VSRDCKAGRKEQRHTRWDVNNFSFETNIYLQQQSNTRPSYSTFHLMTKSMKYLQTKPQHILFKFCRVQKQRGRRFVSCPRSVLLRTAVPIHLKRRARLYPSESAFSSPRTPRPGPVGRLLRPHQARAGCSSAVQLPFCPQLQAAFSFNWIFLFHSYHLTVGFEQTIEKSECCCPQSKKNTRNTSLCHI